MKAYIIRRLIFGVVLIFLSSVISFTILKLSPGTSIAADFDPLTIARGAIRGLTGR